MTEDKTIRSLTWGPMTQIWPVCGNRFIIFYHKNIFEPPLWKPRTGNTSSKLLWYPASTSSSFSFTEPCCPVTITVNQVTPAMTNVSWSHAKGAHLSITSLTSPRGYARCRTQDSQCLMGCITCGTNYTVTMELFSRSKHKSNCTYQGFLSSEWCNQRVITPTKLLPTSTNI